MLLIKARVHDSCELAERFACDDCNFQGDCYGVKLTMALLKYPRELDLTEDKDIIESKEFMEGLDVVCWRIDEAIASRQLLRDEG